MHGSQAGGVPMCIYLRFLLSLPLLCCHPTLLPSFFLYPRFCSPHPSVLLFSTPLSASVIHTPLCCCSPHLSALLFSTPLFLAFPSTPIPATLLWRAKP